VRLRFGRAASVRASSPPSRLARFAQRGYDAIVTDVTCWTLIESAARGDGAAREAFARRYLPVVRAYLTARWSQRLADAELEDAVQDVFLECLKHDGVLEYQRSRRGRGFRAYLFGVVRNIALRAETAHARKLDTPRTQAFDAEAVSANADTSSRAFDRAWAESLMRDAAAKQTERARESGEPALKRVELLRLVFQEERTIADIAREWSVPAETLHRQYARARREFESALREVVAFHAPESAAAVDRECEDLMSLLA
jgi:RNA polymerase sigma-70 factor (ECF subfamily)